MTYSIGFTIIKYQNGFMDTPLGGEFHGPLLLSIPSRSYFQPVVPTPHANWDSVSRAAIFPLMLIFSVAWSLEMCGNYHLVES